MKKKIKAQTVGEALLRLMRERGIEYLFANAGTDFAPIIEAYAHLGQDGQNVPRPITVPHENVAVAAAMGYYLLSGKTQAVMVHVKCRFCERTVLYVQCHARQCAAVIHVRSHALDRVRRQGHPGRLRALAAGDV